MGFVGVLMDGTKPGGTQDGKRPYLSSNVLLSEECAVLASRRVGVLLQFILLGLMFCV